MNTVKPKQMKNTTKTRTKCLLDSVYNRIGANLWEAEESTELAISRISKEKKIPIIIHSSTKKIRPISVVTCNTKRKENTLTLLGIIRRMYGHPYPDPEADSFCTFFLIL